MTMRSKLSRRDFLRMASASTCGAACHHLLSPASNMLAYAADPPGPIKNYVELFLYGGCCKYGMFPKHETAGTGIASKMGTLYRTPAQAASLGHSYISMHSAFAPLIAEANLTGPHLAVICGCGPIASDGNFTRSHDEGQIANQRIDCDYRTQTGIGIGAAMAQAIGHPLSLISFDGAADFTLGGSIPGRSIESLDSGGKPDFGDREWFDLIDANARAAAAPPRTNEQAFVRDAILGMDQNMQVLRNLASINTPLNNFPNTGIGRDLRDVTRVIQGNIGARIFTISIGGFDTHSDQANQHQNLFTQINDALVAFIRNLKLIPGSNGGTAWDETAIVESSDFGGRTFFNGSGTDHGFVGEKLVLGGRINGGVYGEVPNSAKFASETSGYPDASWQQFHSNQAAKEIILYGMGLSGISFPNYPGNLYSPLRIVQGT